MPAGPLPAEPLPAGPLPLGFAAATTPGPLALEQLVAQIEADEAAVARRPDVLAFRSALVDGLVSLATFAGRFSGFDRANALTNGLSDSDADALKVRAGVLSALHFFDDADRMLVRAAELGAPGVDVARGTIAIATGRADDATVAVRREIAQRRPSFRSFADLAAALAARGAFSEADAAYLQALAVYDDVSPFPIAWVQFQRGVMWAEMADRADLAAPLYAESVRRLPGFVNANVHLAELEYETGSREQAIARLTAIADRTEDPEPLGKLADWLAVTDPAASRRYADRATVAYDRLLGVHPLAFADHASEYFSGVGSDPGRALELAERNLAFRQPPRAYLLAIEAAEAAHAQDRLCELVRTTPPTALNASVNLRARVAELAAACAK